MFPTHPQVAGSSLLPFLYAIPLCARIFSTSDLRLVLVLVITVIAAVSILICIFWWMCVLVDLHLEVGLRV